MWIVTRYLRWGILFVILWGILFVATRYGCSTVQTAQMEPFIEREGFVLLHASTCSPDAMEFQRDVVQFESGMGLDGGRRRRTYVARVIGLPGDRIRIEKGKVYRTAKGRAREEQLAEQYIDLKNIALPTEEMEEIIVPRDCLWLMSDNRRKDPKEDSRTFGPIPVHAVDGTVGRLPFVH